MHWPPLLLGGHGPRFGGGQQGAEGALLQCEFVVQREARALDECLLGSEQGVLRLDGEGSGPFDGGIEESLPGQHGLDQPEAQGLPGGNQTAAQNEPGSMRQPDEPGQSLGAAGAGDRPGPTSGNRKWASCEATRIKHPSASSRPPPQACPFTAAITGCGMDAIRWRAWSQACGPCGPVGEPWVSASTSAGSAWAAK